MLYLPQDPNAPIEGCYGEDDADAPELREILTLLEKLPGIWPLDFDLSDSGADVGLTFIPIGLEGLAEVHELHNAFTRLVSESPLLDPKQILIMTTQESNDGIFEHIEEDALIPQMSILYSGSETNPVHTEETQRLVHKAMVEALLERSTIHYKATTEE